MSSETPYRLGDLQLRIMQVLWRRGPTTVAEVRDELGDGLAYTTVATMLRKMEDRSLVRHEAAERKFVYEAAVGADEVTRSMAGDLIERLFDGSVPAAVNHLLTSRQVSPDELDTLERLIHEHRQRQ